MNERKTIILRPHWSQFCIGQLPLIILCIGCLVVCSVAEIYSWLGNFLLIIAAAMATYLAYGMADLLRVRYIITSEQIIYQHGVFVHETDYIELYRVVDYQQNRTLMQQLAGLKSIKIVSGDRNTPVLSITGMRKNCNVIAEIRKRVEYNKKKKGIYEITNRM